MRFCDKCGAPLRDGAKFCGACGTLCEIPEAPKVNFCGQCGIKLEDGDMFCPNCGEPACAQCETENRALSGKASQAEKEREKKFMPVLILALVSLFAIMAFPIINCESDWMDALSGGAATITFWDALEKIGKYGADVLDDLDVVIALTVMVASVAVFCGAGFNSKGTCVFFTGAASLILLFALISFQNAVNDLYFFRDYFTLFWGFWIPLAAFVTGFIYSVCIPPKTVSSAQ